MFIYLCWSQKRVCSNLINEYFKQLRIDILDGRSPLHLVAELGSGTLWHIAVARPDCDMNARDSNGNTPLMKAALQGRIKCSKLLLFSGKNMSYFWRGNSKLLHEQCCKIVLFD